MAELAKKGDSAPLDEGFSQLIAKLKWGIPADFDLAAIIEKKDGSSDLLYFGARGTDVSNPVATLSEDQGVGDSIDGGENEEIMKILNLSEVDKMYIVSWDWGALQKGDPSRFNDAAANVRLEFMDDKARGHNITLECGDIANCTLLATIDNSSPIGANLINESRSCLLKGAPGTTEELVTNIKTGMGL